MRKGFVGSTKKRRGQSNKAIKISHSNGKRIQESPLLMCPDEVILRICTFLWARDICNVSETNKRLYWIAQDRTLWYHQMIKEFDCTLAVVDRKDWMAAFISKWEKRQKEEAARREEERLQKEEQARFERKQERMEKRQYINYRKDFLSLEGGSLLYHGFTMILHFLLVGPLMYSDKRGFPAAMWLGVMLCALLTGYQYLQRESKQPAMKNKFRSFVMKGLLSTSVVIVSLCGSMAGWYLGPVIQPYFDMLYPKNISFGDLFWVLYENMRIVFLILIGSAVWLFNVGIKDVTSFRPYVGRELAWCLAVIGINDFLMALCMKEAKALLPLFAPMMGLVAAIRNIMDRVKLHDINLATDYWVAIVEVVMWPVLSLCVSIPVTSSIQFAQASLANTPSPESIWMKGLGYTVLLLEMGAIGGMAVFMLHKAWTKTLTFDYLFSPDIVNAFKGQKMAFNIGCAYWVFQVFATFIINDYLPVWLFFLIRCVAGVAIATTTAAYPLLLAFYINSATPPTFDIDLRNWKLVKDLRFLTMMGFGIGITFVVHWATVQDGILPVLSSEFPPMASVIPMFTKMVSLVATSMILFWTKECF